MSEVRKRKRQFEIGFKRQDYYKAVEWAQKNMAIARLTKHHSFCQGPFGLLLGALGKQFASLTLDSAMNFLEFGLNLTEKSTFLIRQSKSTTQNGFEF